MTNVKFCVGECVGQCDDEKTVAWDQAEKSQHDLMKDALLWAAGRFPESDSDYSAAVWIEDMEGELIDSEDVSVSSDGEMDFPG